ncbi:MAG: VTT domain-containing protein [Myxococcota bacterium]|nr:VTT domain-containing protein [Myxococcota bacterium]
MMTYQYKEANKNGTPVTTRTSTSKAMTARARAAIVAGAGLAVLVLMMQLPVAEWVLLSVDWFRRQGPSGIVIFACGYALAGLLLLPIFPLTFLSGMIFGWAHGVIAVLPAAVLSATVAGWLGHRWLRNYVLGYLEKKPVWMAVCLALSDHGFKAVALNRMAPLLPFGIQNYGLGAVGVRPAAHFWGTLVGIQPAMWVALYLGTVAHSIAQARQAIAGDGALTGPRLYLLIIGGVAVMGLLVWLGRVALRAQQHLGKVAANERAE